MIIVFCHTKGGVGKSTLATQIAVLSATSGRETLLVDADQQATATLFAAARKEAGKDDGGRLTAIQIRGKTAHQDIARLAGKHDVVVVDVGGRDSMTLRSVLVTADLAVIPVAPRGPELWATDDIVTILTEVRAVNDRLRAVCILNRTDPPPRGTLPSTRVSEAIKYLMETDGFELLKERIGNRNAFADAVASGFGVAEMRPADQRAIDEIRQLYEALIMLPLHDHTAVTIQSR